MKRAILTTAFALLTTTLWYFVESYKLFYVMLWILLILLNYALMLKSEPPEKFVWEIGAWASFLLLLIDELLFNPEKVQLNDYIMFAVLCLYSYRKYLKYKHVRV